MTFSIVAVDDDTGDVGVAAQTKTLAVGAIVPHARAGVGAVATQAHTNAVLGEMGLEQLAAGVSPREALEAILATDPGREERQVGLIDASGDAAAFTGGECPEWAGHIVNKGYAVQGSLLVSELTLRGMVEGFEGSEGNLARRLIEALEGGQVAGGDRRGQQSAALLVAPEGGAPNRVDGILVDLRVDDSEEPIAELRRLLSLWEKQ